MMTRPVNRPTEEQAVTLTHRRAAIRRNLASLPNDWERTLVILHAIGWRVKELAGFEFGVGEKRIGQIILRARRQMELEIRE
jgi:DNA-directed RNA polymerase specialized sigma24 family protein